MASERRGRYARVILDLRTRALDRTFDYAVPEGLDGQVRVGSCVLVTFAHRPAVGYVLGLDDEPSDGVDPARVLPVSQVLAAPLFDEAAVDAMRWMAAEYAAPLLEVTRLFCPPGFTARTERDPRTGAWRLRRDETREVDEVSYAVEVFHPASEYAGEAAVYFDDAGVPVYYQLLPAEQQSIDIGESFYTIRAVDAAVDETLFDISAYTIS